MRGDGRGPLVPVRPARGRCILTVAASATVRGASREDGRSLGEHVPARRTTRTLRG